jgi:uncharacterized protein YndB with AHSA1/START domain
VSASTSASKVVRAPPDEVYEAFMNPAILVEWLPPGEMTGRIHQFDAHAGGGYRMSLFYPPTESAHRGKTAEREDMVSVRFVELVPARRIVQAVTFHTTDPSLMGAMTLVATFEEVPDGTEVAIACTDLPPGLRPEDNEAGSRESLEKLAKRFG